MIQFKDFVPKMITNSGIFSSATMEEIDETVKRANNWIDASGVKLINIETVVLPNIHSSLEKGSEDPALSSSANYNTKWHQIIRVWYREAV